MSLLDRLRHYVTGAIERGEAEPIVGIPQHPPPEVVVHDWLDEMLEAKGTVTGRMSSSQPNMQRIRPPLSPEDQATVFALQRAFVEALGSTEPDASGTPRPKPGETMGRPTGLEPATSGITSQ